MNKKELSQKLLEQGFIQNKYRAFEKTFDGTKISIIIYSGLFGSKIKMIGMCYKFKKELHNNFHDEVFERAIKSLDKDNSNIVIGSLGFDFIEANIIDKNILSNITIKTIEDDCILFVNTIKPLMDEYSL